MLLFLLLLPAIQTLGTKFLSTSKTEPRATFRKAIQGCPSEGYFFERQQQAGIEPAPCYLCYCKSDEIAVCTLRDNARCDDENRSYHTEVETTTRKHRRRKHRRRLPRSPRLMELFFKDGKNDHMLKEMAETNDEDCKPKSSKSIGCPPKNWCTGCLVCDCDDDGIWRCHVMSFCEDQTSQPNSTKIMKTESFLKKIIAPVKKVKKSLLVKKKKKVKEILTKPVQEKKTEKRSVNLNNNNNTDIGFPKNETKMKNFIKKIFKKRLNKTSTSTTTIKPVMPLISVETKRAFLRKNDTVLVIKKYISTISPIESPELLKYKNDSRKLAQILYQHYEANSKETKKTKREINYENRTGSKATHEFSLKNKAKYKYYSGNSKTVGDKVLNMNPRPKYKKNNAIGRKRTNVKEHNNRNTKMKASKDTRKTKRHSFFDIQKELLETGTVSYVKEKQNEAKRKNKKTHYGRKEIRLVNLANRKKRDVSLAIDTNNLKRVGNEKDNISSVNIDQVIKTSTELSTTVENGNVNTSSVSIHHSSAPPTELYTNYEVIGLSLNNYAYTIDNTDTKNGSSSGIVEGDKGNGHTFKNSSTNARKNSDREITTTGSPKQANDTLQTKVDFNEVLMRTEQQHVKNNHSEEPTTPFDYILDGEPDKNDELKINTDITTTTFSAFEDYKNETQLFKNTDNQKIKNDFSDNANFTANLITKENLKDSNDTIRTDFNKAKLEQNVNSNDFEVTKKNLFVRSQNDTSDNIIFKNYKYRPKNEMVAIKYLKNIYSKLISNKNNKTRFSNNAVIKSICDTFGPCKISSKRVNVINSKISQLVYETKRALNVIKIIKGFLQLINDGNNSTGNITEEIKFKNSVSKLNTILTDTYETPGTEREAAIIRNIKSYTNVFIHSVGKFAFILNDIINIIRSDKIKYDSLQNRKIAMKKVIGPKINREILHKIKRLFLKFNLLQNNFMQKMYQVLTDLDAQSHQNLAVDNSKYDQRERRYKTSVKKYMNKINYNLAKLKKFALKMGTRERKKRFVRDDDDAVEYLLTLIEYLLKLNNPVDSRPVTDGIDVLIEAIRRAPNIEAIKKNNLNETSTVPSYAPVKQSSQSSSESVDERDQNLSFSANETKILQDDLSLENWFNDTEYEPSSFGNRLDNEYKTTTPDNARKKTTQANITKFVDVEDIVFNGDQQLKVYMATYPTFENKDDLFLAEKANSKRQKKVKPKSKPVTNKPTATSVTKKKTQSKPQVNKATENSTKSHFDLLNEEYENRLKFKPPTTKPIKVKTNKKQKKTRRPRVKHRTDTKSSIIRKSDVSSITKEIEDEKNRKIVVAEEANLRKNMPSSVDDDPFKSTGEDSASKDVSLLEGVYDEPFKGYFSSILD